MKAKVLPKHTIWISAKELRKLHEDLKKAPVRKLYLYRDAAKSNPLST
jgi:hypothetical protein